MGGEEGPLSIEDKMGTTASFKIPFRYICHEPIELKKTWPRTWDVEEKLVFHKTQNIGTHFLEHYFTMSY